MIWILCRVSHFHIVVASLVVIHAYTPDRSDTAVDATLLVVSDEFGKPTSPKSYCSPAHATTTQLPAERNVSLHTISSS